jgi:energy-coupling factor transporter ATP-binding protein EcfA2
MAIAEFKKNLIKNSKSIGGTFKKADFHVHAPGSADYEYREVDAIDRLAEVVNEGRYAYIVLLEHNKFPNGDVFKTLRDKCPSTTIIPGAEINVVVDVMFKKVVKDHFFHCLVAVDSDDPVKAEFVLESAKKKFTYIDNPDISGFHSNIRDLGRFFRQEGALFIAAHLHQGKGPANSRSVDDIYEDDAFLDFVSNRSFSALEVRELSTSKYFDGKQKTKDGILIPDSTCLRSSDAHHHDHLKDRSRYSLVQVEANTFSELNAALSFRHRVVLEEPALSHSRVIGMHVIGEFIKDEWITFNPGMNCLIGCKGSGKTSLLECLRFVLGVEIPGDRKDAVKKHLNHILGASGYVECLVSREDGSEALLTRRSDSPNRLRLLEGTGVLREVGPGETFGFESAILGWHEIEAVADSPSARVRLVDQVQGMSEIQQLYGEISAAIESARDHLPALQRQIKNLDENLKKYWDLLGKRRTLDRLQGGALLDLQTKYESYLACIEKIKSLKKSTLHSITQFSRTSESAYQFCNAPGTIPDAGVALIVSISQDVTKQMQTLKDARLQSLEILKAKSADVMRSFDQSISSADAGFLNFRDNEYEPKVKELPPAERDILTRQIQIIEETKNLPEIEATCKSLLSDVRETGGQLFNQCSQVCGKREQIWQIREATIKMLSSEIPSIRLVLKKSADHKGREWYQSSYGTEGAEIMKYVTGYGKGDSYENLKALFEKLKNIDMDQGKWDIADVLYDAKLVDLLSVVDADDVDISMQVGTAGFVPIQNLSAGQRCTAVFPLLMRNTKGPLVIDQPEDNLDNRYIADNIAPDLLSKKLKQQFVVTSHNANLVVLADADLIAHADSDGRNGWLQQSGFLACSDSKIRLSVLDVLDGGESALLARQRKYGNTGV